MNQSRWANYFVEALSAESRSAFFENPESALRGYFNLSVVATENLQERGAGGWCDGLSFTDGATILYTQTPYSNKEDFTLAHELAHHLIDDCTDDAFLDWLADVDDPSAMVEHLCDLIASRLLFHERMVESILEGKPISGKSFHDIYESSPGSRHACAIALSERLDSEGCVFGIKDEVVMFCARAHDARPYPWRGNTLPTTHHFRHIEDSQSKVCETFWQNASGKNVLYYGNAYRSGRWVFAILSKQDLWNAVSFHVAQEEVNRAEAAEFKCPCGFRKVISKFPCPVCKTRECPSCGKCECHRRAEREKWEPCNYCTISFRSHLLEGGLCEGCR
jgi:hypothetical protein